MKLLSLLLLLLFIIIIIIIAVNINIIIIIIIFITVQISQLLCSLAGTHQMEPASPLQALEVNPFPSRFPGEVSRVDRGKSQWKMRNDISEQARSCDSSALQKKIALFINLLGLTQEINRDGGSI